MTTTTNLAMPLIAAAQAQKHVTHNEALSALDALVHLSVIERGRLAPPSNAEEGARYLVGEGASGAFAGQDGAIAWFDLGAWRFVVPKAGWRAFVAAESRIVVFDGAVWRDLGRFVRDLEAVDRLGIGTAPDAQNPLAAKLNAALFTARATGEGGTGDLRVVLNKEGPARTVSQLFQSGYGGRADSALPATTTSRSRFPPTAPSGSTRCASRARPALSRHRPASPRPATRSGRMPPRRTRSRRRAIRPCRRA